MKSKWVKVFALTGMFVSTIVLPTLAEEKTYICDKDVDCSNLFFDIKTIDSGEPVTGRIEEYYDNRQLKSEGNCINGKREGSWRFYGHEGLWIADETGGLHLIRDDTGRIHQIRDYYEGLSAEGNYQNGKPDGHWKFYRQNGQLYLEGNYIDGYKDGLWKEYYGNGQLSSEKVYKNSGKEILVKSYYRSGKLLSEKKLILVKPFADETSLLSKNEGISKEYHENGQLKSEVNYTNGKQNGLWKSYYENGQLRNEGNYTNGKQNGLWKYYYENGRLKSEITFGDDKSYQVKDYYENGQLQNEGQKKTILVKDGNIRTVRDGLWKYYYENGRVKSEITYSDDETTRQVKNYYKNGQLENEGQEKTILVKKGNYYSEVNERYGSWKYYRENGRLKKEGGYINNKPDGLWKWYFENGQLVLEGEFKEGSSNGLWKSYDEKNGQLQSEGNYINNNQNGLWKFYDENGNLKETKVYKNGVEVKE